MAARMGPLVLTRTPYAVSSARNNFKIDRYLNFSTGQISDRYSGGVTVVLWDVQYSSTKDEDIQFYTPSFYLLIYYMESLPRTYRGTVEVLAHKTRDKFPGVCTHLQIRVLYC